MHNQEMKCADVALIIEEYRRAGSQEFNDQRLLEHVMNCPECFAVATEAFDAEQLLSQIFEATRAQQQSVTDETMPLQYVRTRVEARGADTLSVRQLKGTSIMSTIFKQLKKRSRLSVSVGFVTLGLLAATLIPFTYQDTIGYEVAFAGVSKDLALDSDRIEELLEELGVEGARVYVTGCETTCNLKISDLKSPEDGKLLIAAFENGGAVQLTNDVTPIVETKEGNLFSKASHFVFVSDDFDGEFSADDLHNILVERLGQNYTMKVEACFGALTGDSLSFSLSALDEDSSGNVWIMDSLTGEAGMMFFAALSDSNEANISLGNGQLTSEQLARLEEKGFTATIETNDEGDKELVLHRDSDSLTIEFNLTADEGGSAWMVDSASGDSVLACIGAVYGDDPLNLRQLIANSGEATLGGLIKKSICMNIDDSACAANWNMGDLAGFDFSAGKITDEQIAKLEALGYIVTITENPDGQQEIVLFKASDSVAANGQATSDKEVIKIVTGDDVAGKGATDDNPATTDNVSPLPEGFELSQNYPNPFNPTTKINYSVPASERVSIEIINVMGQVVRTLVDEEVSAGQHTVEWDATNDNGVKVASGMYFYRFKAGNNVETKKMTLLK